MLQSVKLNIEKIKPGMILHVRRESAFVSRLIRQVLHSWGNHDALCLGVTGYGDSVWPWSQITEWGTLDYELRHGIVEVEFLWPKDATEQEGRLAATWWHRNVYGRFYDVMAYPRLFIKALCGSHFASVAGWEWAWYCTEGCADAWRIGAARDVWHKPKPTPRTTEKRQEAGELLDVSSAIIIRSDRSTGNDWTQEA